MIKKNKRNKIIITLCLLLFMLSFSTVFTLNFTNFNDIDTTLETSATNYLFNSKNYTFNLDDFYDDANLYKTFTDAEFQTEWFNDTELAWSGTYDNDTVTPVNNTETQLASPSGHYPATYSFEGEVGLTGTDIGGITYDDIISGGGTSEIIEWKTSHKDVLYISSTNTWKYSRFTHGVSEAAGTIEWWMSFGQTNVRTQTVIWGVGTLGYFFSWSDGTFCYYNGTGNQYFETYNANEWYNFKIDFDCDTNTFDLYLDDILIFDDEPTASAISSISYIRFGDHNQAALHSMWIDGLGFSWDPEYTIGDNLYPDNINMIEGSYDYSDNMKVNDDTSTNFTSTYTDGYIYETPHQWDNFTFTKGTGDTIEDIETIDGDYSVIKSSEAVVVPDEFIDNIDIIDGTYQSGAVADTWVDNGVAYVVKSLFDFGMYWTTIDLNFDPAEGGRNFLVSAHLTTDGTSANLIMNGGAWKTGVNIDFDNEVYNGLTSIRYSTGGSGHHYANIFYLKIVEIADPVDAELDVQIDMQIIDPDLNSIEYFKYSHKTNVSVDIDLDIYNWDTTDWYEIESVDNSANFDDDSFTLGSASPYVSGTDEVRIRFQGTNAADFELLIDRFRLDYLNDNADLEMTITFSFARYNEDLLAMNVTSWQKTNITQLTNFSIWNYDTSDYIQISSSSETTFTKKNYNTASPSDFMSPTGEVKLHWIGTNTTSNFNFSIDYLFVQIYYKLNLEHSKAFYTNGVFRYRWEITGSIHYTQWVTFEVIDPVPNFHAISESDYTTRWILQNASLTPVEDFHDDINTNYWSLEDVSLGDIIIEREATHDSYISSPVPDMNFGSLDYAILRYNTPQKTLLRYDFNDYLFQNCTTNSTLSLYFYFVASVEDSYIYAVEQFDESTVTWNNQPATIQYISTTSLTASNDWYVFDAGDNLSRSSFRLDLDTAAGTGNFHAWTSEKAGFEPFFTYNVSKNYYGSGYAYMQTNTTESIGLQSIDYTTHYNLSSGDYFEVDFQTSSDSQIDLLLYQDGVLNKSLILSASGNTNFNRHTVQLSVDEYCDFDQLKISSTFEDTDYIRVYDVKTYKYTLVGDYADFVVGSRRTESVYLTPDIYNLKISDYSSGHVYENENITIGSTDFYKVFTPTATKQCRIALYNTEDLSLEFTDYHISINRSLGGSYFQFALLENIFSADVDTTVYVTISDRFNTLIRTYEKGITSATDYLDIELEVYSLQIKNLMEQKTTIDINTTYTYPLLSDESIYFILSEAQYVIGYYDPNDVYKQFTIDLNSNQAYELNRSKLCFLSYADQQGNSLSFDNYRTYINGSQIYEQIFYKEIGDSVNITVNDRYNISIHSEIYDVISGDNYIPVTLTMYSLKVMSQQLVFNHINITRDSDYYESDMYWSEWIAPSEIIDFRLFAGYYTINVTNVEDSSFSLYDYTLNGDDVILISSDNTLYNVLYNIANVNTTIGNQITAIEINITNQNSAINNSVVSIVINLSNVNSTLGNLLTSIDLDVTNIANNVSSLYFFTENSFVNLNNSIDDYFIYMENSIISINQSISNLVIGVDNSILILNGTITTMFTEMNNQFIVTQTSIDFSFTSLNQSVFQLANNISTNQVILCNLIEQRANDIDDNIINIQTLINLLNSTVANESLVVQTLVNIIGSNLTENHVIINNLINLLGNNITENNLQLVSILEVIGNNITTNHFVLQTLIDVIGNNITNNHIELLTNLNLINTTIGVNQIELINRILLVNSTISDLVLELTNQIFFINDTIYTAVLNLSTSVEFGVDCILGNISLTYQQNEFLTELYKETMFSQLLNWSGVAYNYSLMEDRIDVWDFINNYKNQSVTILLRYNDLIDNLTVSAQNTIEQYLPESGVEYRLWSEELQDYVGEWTPLPENRTVNFGFFEADISTDVEPIVNTFITYLIVIIFLVGISFAAFKLYYVAKERKTEVPAELVNLTVQPHRKKIKGVVDNRLH